MNCFDTFEQNIHPRPVLAGLVAPEQHLGMAHGITRPESLAETDLLISSDAPGLVPGRERSTAGNAGNT